jgi:peptidase E
MRIGDMIFGLFTKEKEEVKKTVPKIEFIALAKNTCDQKFYLETLKLKLEQIELFLQFCEADPKSKALIENHNVLSMMDFLSAKNIEFQRLKSQVN